jgi:hypothetical protein
VLGWITLGYLNIYGLRKNLTWKELVGPFYSKIKSNFIVKIVWGGGGGDYNIMG